MLANQSTKIEQDREFRELDSSISSNLSEREGKKERKRRIERERENDRSKGCLARVQESECLSLKKKKKKRTKKEMAISLLSKWRCFNFKRGT